MKSKIVVFKALAAIIAVVGAIASVSANSALVASTAYVNYTTTTNAIVRSYCVAASPHATCDRPGNEPCLVTVTITGQPSQQYSAKRSNCAVLQSDTDSPIDATITLPPTAILQ
jgi:uncharacterized membrane protein